MKKNVTNSFSLPWETEEKTIYILERVVKSLCCEHFMVEAKNPPQVFKKGREGTQRYRSSTKDSVTFSGGLAGPTVL